MINRLIIFLGTLSLFASCGGPDRDPAVVFMPDMYYPVPYEPYKKATYDYPNYTDESQVPLFDNNYNMTALSPVDGTVPRTEWGVLPYELPDSNEGYNASKAIQSPLDTIQGLNREKNLERGKKLYGQLCAACHGLKGDGQGTIVQSGAYSGVPNYKDREITVGSVYHVIMYGRNAMGSYATQINQEDRWRVAEYVTELRNQ